MTRVRSQGTVKVTFNVITRDMKKLGYDTEAASVSIPHIGGGSGGGTNTIRPETATGTLTGTMTESHS